MTTDLLTRIWNGALDALFAHHLPNTAEQATDALQQVTRWAWLPALSGVAVAGEHARRAHETVVGGDPE
jgi:hypothetical protein